MKHVLGNHSLLKLSDVVVDSAFTFVLYAYEDNVLTVASINFISKILTYNKGQ